MTEGILRRVYRIINPHRGIWLDYRVFSQIEQWRWANLDEVKRPFRPLFDTRATRVTSHVITLVNQ